MISDTLELENRDSIGGFGPVQTLSARESKPLRQQIFEQVRAHALIPRSELAKNLNISPATVTALTADLISEGLLREVTGTFRETSRGRPPVALEVISEARYTVGIKISEEAHSAVLCDFSGNVVAQAKLRTPSLRKPMSELVRECQALTNKLLSKADKTLADVSILSAGIAGIVDHRTGIVTWSPTLSERDADLQGALSNAFKLPCTIDNDANMLTLAELWFGIGRTRPDFVVVTIEHGVGMGLVMNSQIFRGTRGLGTEFGHTKVQLDGALCRCGRRGCLEAYLADYALAREASTALGISRQNPMSLPEMLETLYDQAKSGNKGAQTIFRRAGRYLAVGLSNIINLVDPEMIILSGEKMRFDYLYADEVIEETQALTLNQSRSPCQIEIQTWDQYVWARGAAALALGELTDQIFSEAKAA